ncbi:MAG: tetratricopeptide repeat protein [Planctomycetes bacterium]|nr:tetratricopeptide repeat protein [Planctomycetota bacterium]
MRGLLGEARREGELAGVRRWLHAHERGLIVAWLVGVSACFALLFAWGVWQRGLESVVSWWYARSGTELARAERLYEAGRFEDAAALLERIDANHPAVIVKHRLDQEREEVLTLLGRSYVALDKKKRALETFDTLVAFDPRNWRNHYARAEALRAFVESDLAEAAYREVLRLHPTHFPTVETLTGMLFDVATLYAKVVELHQQYFNAWLLGSVELSLGATSVGLDVPVDGLPHAFDVPFEVAANFAGDARVATHGYSARIGELALVPAQHVGVAAPIVPAIFAGPWTPTAAKLDDQGRFAAASKESSFAQHVAVPNGAARVRIELTLYKQMSKDLWFKVEKSYSNRLLFDQLEDVRRRTVIGGVLEAGSLFEE